MQWQYTLTYQSYKKVLKLEQKGASHTSSRGRRILSRLAFFYLLIFFLILLSLPIQNGFIMFRNRMIYFPIYLLLLVSLCLALYQLIPDKRPRWLFRKSNRIFGTYAARAENGWFYFTYSCLNGQYSFVQRPLRDITLVRLQEQGVLVGFSNKFHIFLPKEAFSFSSPQETQRFLQAECLAALNNPELSEPLRQPFPDMPQADHPSVIDGEPLASRSFHIPYQDRGEIYLECMRSLRRHLFFYLDESFLPIDTILLLFLFYSIINKTLAYIAFFLIIHIYVIGPFVQLPRTVHRQMKDGSFALFSAPCRYSLYPGFWAETSEHSFMLTPCSKFTGLYETKSCYYLAERSPLLFRVIPKKSFADKEDELKFINCLRSMLGKHGK